MQYCLHAVLPLLHGAYMFLYSCRQQTQGACRDAKMLASSLSSYRPQANTRLPSQAQQADVSHLCCMFPQQQMVPGG